MGYAPSLLLQAPQTTKDFRPNPQSLFGRDGRGNVDIKHVAPFEFQFQEGSDAVCTEDGDNLDIT